MKRPKIAGQSSVLYSPWYSPVATIVFVAGQAIDRVLNEKALAESVHAETMRQLELDGAATAGQRAS